MIDRLARDVSDGDVEIRRNAVLMVRGLDESVAVEQKLRVLLQAMQDPNWRVRKTAADIIVMDFPIESFVKGLVNLLHLEGNAGARNSAIEVFVRLGKKVTDFLIEEFKSPDGDIRKFIIDIIGQISDRKSLPLLISALNDEDDNVRAAAVEYLGSMKEPTVVERLVEVLRGPDLWTAYPAVEALGKIGDRAALPALIESLSRGTLKEPALKALAEIAEPGTIASIVPLLDDKSKSIQHEVLVTLEKMYKKGVSEDAITGGLRNYLGEKTMTVLLNHAWSSKHEVRVASILFLGLLRDRNALEPLMELSQEEAYAGDVRRALVFIGRDQPQALLQLFNMENNYFKRVLTAVAADVASSEYLEPLISMVDSDDGHVRANALFGLSRIGDERAIPVIIRRLTDPYVDVQERAVEALYKFKDWLNIAELTDMLRDPNPVLRKNIAALFGRIATPVMAEDLCFAMQDSDTLVRRASINALANISSARAVECLMSALTDEDPNNRICAILGLGATAGDSAVEPLLLIFRDNDDMLKVYAIKSLGMIGSPKAIPELIKLFEDINGFVVNAAVEAVAKIGGDSAREALRRLLASKDMEIRRTAIRAIASLDGTEGDIIPFLDDQDWATRAAAVESLSTRADASVIAKMERMLEGEDDTVVRKALEKAINAR